MQHFCIIDDTFAAEEEAGFVKIAKTNDPTKLKQYDIKPSTTSSKQSRQQLTKREQSEQDEAAAQAETEKTRTPPPDADRVTCAANKHSSLFRQTYCNLATEFVPNVLGSKLYPRIKEDVATVWDAEDSTLLFYGPPGGADNAASVLYDPTDENCLLCQIFQDLLRESDFRSTPNYRVSIMVSVVEISTKIEGVTHPSSSCVDVLADVTTGFNKVNLGTADCDQASDVGSIGRKNSGLGAEIQQSICRIIETKRRAEFSVRSVNVVRLSSMEHVGALVKHLNEHSIGGGHRLITIAVQQQYSAIPTRTGRIRLFQLAGLDQDVPGSQALLNTIASLSTAKTHEQMMFPSVVHPKYQHSRSIFSLVGSSAAKPNSRLTTIFMAPSRQYFHYIPHLAKCNGYAVETLIDKANYDIEQLLMQMHAKKEALLEQKMATLSQLDELEGKISGQNALMTKVDRQRTLMFEKSFKALPSSWKDNDAELCESRSVTEERSSRAHSETSRSEQEVTFIEGAEGEKAVESRAETPDSIPDDAEAAFFQAELGLDAPPCPSLRKKFKYMAHVLKDERSVIEKRKREDNGRINEEQNAVETLKNEIQFFLQSIKDVKSDMYRAQCQKQFNASHELLESTDLDRMLQEYVDIDEKDLSYLKVPPLKEANYKGKAARFVEQARAKIEQQKGRITSDVSGPYEPLAAFIQVKNAQDQQRYHLQKKIQVERDKSDKLRKSIAGLQKPREQLITVAHLYEYCALLYLVYKYYDSLDSRVKTMVEAESVLDHTSFRHPNPLSYLAQLTQGKYDDSAVGIRRLISEAVTRVEKGNYESYMWPADQVTAVSDALDTVKRQELLFDRCTLLTYHKDIHHGKEVEMISAETQTKPAPAPPAQTRPKHQVNRVQLRDQIKIDRNLTQQLRVL